MARKNKGRKRAEAKQLPSGKWRILVNLGYENGKQVRKSITADTQREAEHLADVYRIDWEREQKQLKESPQNAVDRQKLMTLRQAIEKYIETTEKGHSVKTSAGYDNILKNFFQDILDIRLCDLTNDMIQESINRSAARPSKTTGNPLSEKTMKNVKGLITPVLNRYYPELHVNIMIPKGMKKQEEVFVHDLQTINNILALNNATNKLDVELPVRLGLFGFRMNEVLGFRKQDVDLETGIITINQTVVYQNKKKIIRPYAKTEKSMRSILLAPDIIELIRAIPDEQEYLVTVTDKGLQYRWKAVQERYGCERLMSFHALRHWCASFLAEAGIPDSIRQDLLGHTNLAMTSHYTHVFDDAKMNAMQHFISLYNTTSQG